MDKFRTTRKNLSFTKDALSTPNPSLRQVSSVEGKRAKREDKPSSSHLSTLSEKIKMKKNPTVTYQKRKGHYHSIWRHNQDAANWVKLSRAQDQWLQFWQTRSNAIIVHDLEPANYIYRAISRNGKRNTTRKTLYTSTTTKDDTHIQMANAAAVTITAAATSIVRERLI